MLYTCQLRGPFRRQRFRVIFLSATFFLFLVIFITYRVLPSWLSQKSERSYETIDSNLDVVYGIVFDAGSTGSRIHVFRFKRNTKAATELDKFELLSEDFFQVKPGLSSYADDPSEAAKSLSPLLEKARDIIPASQWPKTATVLQATAGLRLLPGSKSDAILHEVNATLRKTGLYMPWSNAVSVMEGQAEGLMSWMTINFLLQRLSYPSSTFGALDLGGGSTQITFLPARHETLASAPRNFITKYPIGKKKFDFYTNSYLGLGLQSARHQMMGGTENNKQGDSTSSVLSSPCLPPGYKGTWEHRGKKYTIETGGLNGFYACLDSAKILVTELYSVDSQKEMKIRPFFAFSYFFDRAKDAGLILKGSTGRIITVSEYLQAAEKECSTNTAKAPFLCMDLAYISALFTNGYGLLENTKLHVMKKLNNVEISWCLGLMVQILYVSDNASNEENRARNLVF